MRKHITQLARHPLISGSTIVLGGSLLANFLNYLFNLILGRFLTVTDYGIYAALISLLSVFGIFPSAFTTIFAKFSARYKVKGEVENIGVVFINGLRIVLLFGTVVLTFFVITVFYSATFLHIDDIRLLLLIFAIIFLSILTSLPNGILQGEMRFYLLSLLAISTPLLKIVIGLSLLLIGFKIFGVTVAMFISSLLTFSFILLFFLKKYRRERISEENQSLFLKEFKGYSLKFFLAMVGVTILTSGDVILVKHFFSPEKAGQYAALSLMGKAIFYLTSPIYFVFFPLIAQKKEKKEKLFNTVFLAISIITLASVGLSFVYFLFPNIILSIFFPAKEYALLTSYLGPFSLYIIVFSIAMLMNNFLLSIGKTGVYKINLIVSAIFIGLMYAMHNSFHQVIAVLFSTAFLLLALHLLYYGSTIYDKKEKISFHHNSNL